MFGAGLLRGVSRALDTPLARTGAGALSRDGRHASLRAAGERRTAELHECAGGCTRVRSLFLARYASRHSLAAVRSHAQHRFPRALGAFQRGCDRQRSAPMIKSLLEHAVGALMLAREEWTGPSRSRSTPLSLGEDVPAVDMTLKHRSGFTRESRIFLCNRKIQGGAFKRQLDSALLHHGHEVLLHAARERVPDHASKKNQSVDIVPQVPRKRRAVAGCAQCRVGTNDVGPGIPRASQV